MLVDHGRRQDGLFTDPTRCHSCFEFSSFLLRAWLPAPGPGWVLYIVLHSMHNPFTNYILALRSATEPFLPDASTSLWAMEWSPVCHQFWLISQIGDPSLPARPSDSGYVHVCTYVPFCPQSQTSWSSLPASGVVCRGPERTSRGSSCLHPDGDQPRFVRLRQAMNLKSLFLGNASRR